MKKDILLSGVGGQGILTIAVAIADAAMREDIHIKQAEVHGMSQRGGDVQSTLRLSTQPIQSDLVPLGGADLIVSMEPMEALRYLPYLKEDGWVVTASNPLKNITNYPADGQIEAALQELPQVLAVDIDRLARDNGMPKCANIILLGVAAGHIGILQPRQLRESVGRVFAAKGEAVVEMNLRAFDLGMEWAANNGKP